jgi:hypothetical protein
MKKEVIAAVKEFFRPGITPDGVNDIAIVHIPKVSYPDIANMAPFAISSSLLMVIHDNMINETNHIV